MASKYIRQEKSAPKHIHPSSAQSLLKAPFVPEAPRERPGWKGVGFTKSKKGEKLQTREKNALKAAAAAAAWVDPVGIFFVPGRRVVRDEDEEEGEGEEDGEAQMVVEDQGLNQKIADLFRVEFPCVLDQEGLRPRLEDVRLALAGLDNGRAFKEREGREAYTVRWSPGTALATAALVGGWAEEELRDVSVFQRLRGEEEGKALRVLALGGGPAEVAAWAELLRHAQPDSVGSIEAGNRVEEAPKIKLALVDCADWTGEVDTLTTALVSPPKLSKYASAAAKAAAVPFLAKGAMEVRYLQRDILAPWREEELAQLVGQEPAIVTMVSTLPALQKQSVAKTVTFFMQLTRAAPRNTLLLVLDEPEAAVEKGEKRYPLEFLLELALLGKGVVEEEKEESGGEEVRKRETASWERLVGDEVRNYTVEKGLKYPLGLGVVSMQVHLFRRT